MRRYSTQVLPEPARLDLTAMLDVVFIMLIFFVVTATFVQEVGITVPESNPATEATNREAAIVVAIDHLDGLTIAGRHADIRTARAHLTRLQTQQPDAVVVIHPHPESTVNAITWVMDSARLAGIQQVSFADSSN